NQRCRPAETILTAGLERRLREAAESAADDGVRPKLVGEADARLPLVGIATDDRTGLSVDASKKLCAVNLERARGDNLGQLLANCVAGIGGQDLGVGGLGRVADGIDDGRIEVAGQAVVALGDRPLVIPPQAEVEGELLGYTPIILEVENREALRVERVSIARE